MTLPPTAQPRNPILTLGSLMAGSFDITEQIRKSFAAYGDVYQVRYKSRNAYVIRHPEHIQQVLVTDAARYHKDPDYTDPQLGLAKTLGNSLLTSDGEFWQRQRKLI